MEIKKDIYEVGNWNLIENTTEGILAYYLFLTRVKELKDSGEWIKRESTFVMDQRYFQYKSNSYHHYKRDALMVIRNQKIEKLCQLNQEKI